jgi:hypothetical protein
MVSAKQKISNLESTKNIEVSFDNENINIPLIYQKRQILIN